MRALLLSLMLCSAAAPALAQDQATLNAMAQDCLVKFEAGELVEATKIAATFEKLSDKFIGDPALKDGAKCLSLTTGEKWLYDFRTSRFITKEVYDVRFLSARILQGMRAEKQKAETKAAALRAQADRELDDARSIVNSAQAAYEKARSSKVYARTLKACYDLYSRDQTTALVSPVCNPIFIANGLPVD